MIEWSLYLADEAATVAAGRALGAALASSHCALSVHLMGDLGAGKTTLTRGVLQQFGHSGAVKSPTYTLVEPYECAGRMVHHFDLYRLGDPEELEYMGIRDYFAGTDICLIEWPTRGEGVLPRPDLVVSLMVQEPGRVVKLTAESAEGSNIIARITEHSD